MYLKKIKIKDLELENNLILAPMAGVTDLPFRKICKEFGPGLVCTEMVSSKAIYHDDTKTKLLMNTDGEKRPISMQIFGSDEETMGYAAKYVSKIADIVDINMGCPAPKVVKNGDGSKLLLDIEKAEKVIKSVVKNSSKPKVTWKKVKKATGYEIQYTTKGFGNKKATKTIKVSKAKITSAQLKKLKKKTRYKVRIRAVYTKAGYQTATSKWSAIKTVKTK